jgi:hypothetical protein
MAVASAVFELTTQFIEESKGHWKAGNVLTLYNPLRLFNYLLGIWYIFMQGAIIWAFKHVSR